MGKKITPGENGLPSFNMAIVSSNDAKSIPHKLSPWPVSSMIAPQNLSRGLQSVTTTIEPAWKGAVPEGRVGETAEEDTTRLSPDSLFLATYEGILFLNCVEHGFRTLRDLIKISRHYGSGKNSCRRSNSRHLVDKR